MSASFGQSCVLYADADAPMRELVRDTLEDLNLGVVLAAEPEEALSFARSRSPSIIVTDLQFPDGGLAYLARLREAVPEVPILLVSAYTDAKVRTRATELGVIALSKPVRMHELVAAIRAAIATSAMERSRLPAVGSSS